MKKEQAILNAIQTLINNGGSTIIKLPRKEVKISIHNGYRHTIMIDNYHEIEIINNNFNKYTLLGLLKRVNAPDLGITYDLEYSRNRPVMGWGVENFHVPTTIPCWLTNKEMTLYKECLKYSGTGRFATTCGLWDMFLELRDSVAERYW